MMYTKTQMLTMELINNYKPLTKADEIRLNTAKKRLIADVQRLASGQPTDSGLHGKVSEILGQSKKATSKDVHSANAIDGYVFIDGKRLTLEHKTNYTDIDKWINKPIEWQKKHYIRYTINDVTKAVTNKKTGHTTPAKRLQFDGILSFYDLFSIGYKFDAIKPHTTNNGESHIYLRHGTKICKYLNSLNIAPFERNGRYTSEDFIIEW